MTRSSKKQEISIRVRLDSDTIKRIDKIAGERGRQRFIQEAIEWRLDSEYPPAVAELVTDVEELKERVEYLEKNQPVGSYISELKDEVIDIICRDETDRRLLAYFIKNEGATTPELAENILGSESKRRTILDRIARINTQAKRAIGVEILMHEKGIINGKRGAWWLVHTDRLMKR